MAIKSIQIFNYKSFKNLDINLNDFNILIGGNASGKSNFIEILLFLKDIYEYGLENAISLHGGIQYLRNINMKSNKYIKFKIIFDDEYSKNLKKKEIRIKSKEFQYEFFIKLKKNDYMVTKDNIRITMEYFKLIRKTKKGEVIFNEGEKIGDGEIQIRKKGEKSSINFNIPDDVPIERDELIPIFFKDNVSLDSSKDLKLKEQSKDLMLNTILSIIPFPWYRSFKNISIFDFDPKLPKKAISFTGKMELEKDGKNLALVYKHIKENKEKNRKFKNIIKYILPFIKDCDVSKLADRYLLFNLREKYSPDFLPASLISDGTINITLIILALYFDNSPLIIIEEPERNIHPSLVSKIVEMLKDASKEKQIIITTHNPEIVKYANIEDLLLIIRDKKGYSNISRPYKRKEVKIFLKNKLGIEDLYVKNILDRL